MTKNIFSLMIDKINTHDVDGILSLISSDYTLIDALGNRMTGTGTVSTAWKYYFSTFPDYRLEIDDIFENDSTVAAFGFASGSIDGNDSDKSKAWRLPVSLKAVIADGKVKLWQVYADTKVPFDIQNKNQKNTGLTSPAGITGLGGVFFMAKDRASLMEWYDKHLGTKFAGGMSHGFMWRDWDNPGITGRTEFGIFPDNTKYFQPSQKPFMLNFRVKDLVALMESLKKEGVPISGEIETYDYGKFGWIIDPEGNKLELWEPAD